MSRKMLALGVLGLLSMSCATPQSPPPKTVPPRATFQLDPNFVEQAFCIALYRHPGRMTQQQYKTCQWLGVNRT